jgi:hypothetical protein
MSCNGLGGRAQASSVDLDRRKPTTARDAGCWASIASAINFEPTKLTNSTGAHSTRSRSSLDPVYIPGGACHLGVVNSSTRYPSRIIITHHGE